MTVEQIIQKSFRHLSRWFHNNGTMTIITGANAPFYDSLVNNLLSSINKWEPDVLVYIWDLGLTEGQIDSLNKWYESTGIRGKVLIFPFEELPAHFAMDRHNYAFKSYCIYHTMLRRETDYYFWLDAGCGLREQLYPERNLLKWYGFFSPYSSTTVAELTYPSVLMDFCDGICHFGNKRMLSGGVVGLSIHNKQVVALITEWKNLTFLENLLSPIGSNRENHRQDQSLLSLCYYSRNKCVPLLARRGYHFVIHLNKH